MDPKLIGLLCKSDAKVTLLLPEASKYIKFRMLNNGFHHLYIIMRLRRADSGIDMDPKLIGLLCKSDAKVTLLLPEASKSQI